MGDVHTVGRPLNTWHGYCCKIVISLIDPVSGPRPATSQLRRDLYPAQPPQRSTSTSSAAQQQPQQQHQRSSGSSSRKSASQHSSSISPAVAAASASAQRERSERAYLFTT